MRADQFERLYQEHAQPLLAFLVYRTGDTALAEDLLADTFERVLRTRTVFDRRRASEKTWLYTIALNLLRDHARRQATATRALERAPVPSGQDLDRFDAVEARELVQYGLAFLSEEEREAVSLRFGADLSVPEIAKVLGEKLSTVEGRVYRALRKLRDHLD